MIPKVSSSRSFFWLNLVLLLAVAIIFSNFIQYILPFFSDQTFCIPLYTRLKFNFDVLQFIWLGIGGFFLTFLAQKKITRTFLVSYPVKICLARENTQLWLMNMGSIALMQVIHQTQGWCFMNIIDYRLLVVTWILSLMLWVASSLTLLISLNNLIRIIKGFKKTILKILFFSFVLSLIGALSFSNITLEGMLSYSFFKPTIFFITHFFNWLDISLTIDIPSKIIGIHHYVVQIGPGCMGYKGMGILTLLTSVYLYQFKNVLKFPNAFFILPLIYIAVLLTNSLRISLLLLIGAYISPEIASIGFHSSAGWINIFLIAILALYCLTHLSFFTYKKSRFTIDLNHRKVKLVPEICLISLTLIFLLVNNGFDWAYPIKIILVALVIKHLWSKFRISFSPLKWMPFLIGLMTVFVWLLLVKDDIKTSRLFAEHIFSAQSWQAYLWLIFRILGSSVIVPIAEELCFRGYFFDATQQFLKSKFNEIKKINLNIAALIFTSILFGSLHSDWLAGFLAGLLFSIARIYRNRISDAIIAHAVTNFFLSLYIIYYQSWSLW